MKCTKCNEEFEMPVKDRSSKTLNLDTTQQRDNICRKCACELRVIRVCEVCGHEIWRNEPSCSHCDFWRKQLERQTDPNMIITPDYSVYHIAPDLPENSNDFKGFGGREFVIQKIDGTIVVSHNLWHGGTVPEHLRDLVIVNAKFLNAGEWIKIGDQYVLS